MSTPKSDLNISDFSKKQFKQTGEIARFQLKYALLFLILFLSILVTFVVVIYKQNSQHLIYTDHVLTEDFKDYVKHVDQNFRNISSRIRELKLSAQFSLFESSKNNTNMPYGYKYLQEVNDGIYRFHMDDIKEDEKDFVVVNITGNGKLCNQNTDFRRTMKMYLDLMDGFHGFKQSIPDAHFIYSMTNNTFCQYPWLASSDFKFEPDLLKYDIWKLALESENPKRKLLWTDVYWEQWSDSLMASCGAPVYEDNKFIGIVGVDIMVKFMNSVVAAFKPEQPGMMLIFDSKHNLLAYPSKSISSKKATIPLKTILPKELHSCINQINSLSDNQIHNIKDWRILHSSLEEAPYKVLYIFPKINFLANLFSRIGWDVVVFIFAMLVLVVTFLLLTYLKFILPVERFVNFILIRNGGMQQANIPHVPKMWRSWFSTVDGIFNENVKLYDNLHVRNIELVKKNEELSNQMTARTKAEQEKESLITQLNFSEKMRAIGQLAGGVAHDFNNQLSIILSTIKVLDRKVAGDEKLKSYCNRILTASRRSADLVSQLLAFSRQGNYTITPVDFHSLINEVDNLLEHTINKNISLNKDLKAKKSNISGDSTQLQNAVLNLAINARDAMPNGGKISFVTENITQDDSILKNLSDDSATGDYLKITISDTGMGIQEDILPRIFEPFFTTKEKKGHGMGLAAVYGTIQTHKGFIDVMSVPEQGTTFTIYLPLLTKDSSPVIEKTEFTATNIHKKNILLVDDERDVCMSIAEELNMAGFDVVFFDKSIDAIDYYQNNWQTIHIVLLDIIMPDLDGHQTFIKMQQINPAIKAIVFSGYSLEGESQKMLDEGVLALFKKPLETDILIEKISEVLTDLDNSSE